ncbi:MAG: hypothetical protein AB1483_11490 [Candidatus Zixiibacteriota bacterium]
MDKKATKTILLAVAVGAAYGLLYPFITDAVGLQDTDHMTTVLPISVAVGALCGLVVGWLWNYFRSRKTTHGW